MQAESPALHATIAAGIPLIIYYFVNSKYYFTGRRFLLFF